MSATALICLVTLTFDLLTSKKINGYPCEGLSSCQFLTFISLSVLELGRGTRQTDGRTDRHRPSVYNAPDKIEIEHSGPMAFSS